MTPLQAAESKFGVRTIERFYAKTKEDSTPGSAFEGTYCVLWTKAKSRGGLRKWIQRNQYGNFHVTLPWPPGKKRPKYGRGSKGGGIRKTYKSHRFAWEVIRGPIPRGKEPHHKCHRTLCVNVNHMMLLTGRQNIAEANRRRRGRKKNAA